MLSVFCYFLKTQCGGFSNDDSLIDYSCTEFYAFIYNMQLVIVLILLNLKLNNISFRNL